MSRQALPPGGHLFVSGWFDPLLAAHASQLESLRVPGRSLVVVITDPPDPLLPARARAELVAALRPVDYVVLEGEAEIHLEPEHARLRESLMAHARRRCAAL